MAAGVRLVHAQLVPEEPQAEAPRLVPTGGTALRGRAPSGPHA